MKVNRVNATTGALLAGLLKAGAGCDAATPTEGSPTAALPEQAVTVAQSAATSTDYPGPCQNEVTAPGTPAFLSVDIRTKPFDARIINLAAPGRFRLGISCVYTEFKLTRLGDGQVVFRHQCNKHGFGWYDAVNLPAGSYRATAEARRLSFDGIQLVLGHGTMDTYAYVGNGGAYQPVNCSPQGSGGSCGDGACNGTENCSSCSADCGACPTSPPWNCRSPHFDMPAHTSICAEDTRKACLNMQGDGNLVVYDENGVPRWASNTAGRPGSVAAFQGDGNLMVYQNGQPLWASNTASGDPANVNYLCVQGDGNVVVYKWPRPVWATNTNH